jgi:hypothetical protein
MSARLAQQEDEKGLMEGRTPVSPNARPPEVGRRGTSVRQSKEELSADFGKPQPSSRSQLGHFRCRRLSRGRDFHGSPHKIRYNRPPVFRRETLSRYQLES